MDARHAQNAAPSPYHHRSKMDARHAQNGGHNGLGYNNSALQNAPFDAFWVQPSRLFRSTYHYITTLGTTTPPSASSFRCLFARPIVTHRPWAQRLRHNDLGYNDLAFKCAPFDVFLLDLPVQGDNGYNLPAFSMLLSMPSRSAAYYTSTLGTTVTTQ